MRTVTRSIVVAVGAAYTLGAAAHGASDIESGPDFETWPTVAMLLVAVAYVLGWIRLARRTHAGRFRFRRSAWLFGTGWLSLAGAVLSPLHAAGARSFSLHMIEHEIIMLVAAPLLALARPLAIMLWALPHRARRAIARTGHRYLGSPWRAVTRPLTATVVQIAVLWAWHAPRWFDAALRDETWHTVQHVSFLVAALLFWWALARNRVPARQPIAAACLFVTSLAGGLLGALMALSVSPWYARYAEMGVTSFGLTPVQDQQLAGLLMWIPGGLVHAGVGLAFIALWLRHGEGERRVPLAQ